MEDLSYKEKIFNYRLSRARCFIECTFGILSNKWRIFHRTYTCCTVLYGQEMSIHTTLRYRGSNLLQIENITEEVEQHLEIN
ncbi:hypothetical protein LAZ67_4001204 [Cordylochernes scorpioides]|uniref:DDE Tnp4 domain-containing protein n=1 Tax=Cordylochernes scorpioides TaxID=51811 RepID=A0ABY6KBS2_9ARAC|nr:hypothetical protein LAZ67_4001204 [Cordylochernes scorpioides]